MPIGATPQPSRRHPTTYSPSSPPSYPADPLSNFVVMPQIEVGVLTHLTLGLMGPFDRTRRAAAALRPPRSSFTRGRRQLMRPPACISCSGISLTCSIIDWSLKRHGETIDAKSTAAFGAR
jgi:hypothetical protein